MSVEAGIDLDIRREQSHGIKRFETIDGMPVVAISMPSWKRYYECLESLGVTDGYIVSPQEITWPYAINDTTALKDTAIDARQKQVQALSEAHPYARILLGSVKNHVANGWRGSVAAFHAGELISEQYQTDPINENVQTALDDVNHGLLTGTDLIDAMFTALINQELGLEEDDSLKPYLKPEARSLIVMSCMGSAVPRYDRSPVPESLRSEVLLHTAVEWLMSRHLNIHEVIVVDRAIRGSGLKPNNTHFKRVS